MKEEKEHKKEHKKEKEQPDSSPKHPAPHKPIHKAHLVETLIATSSLTKKPEICGTVGDNSHLADLVSALRKQLEGINRDTGCESDIDYFWSEYTRLQ